MLEVVKDLQMTALESLKAAVKENQANRRAGSREPRRQGTSRQSSLS